MSLPRILAFVLSVLLLAGGRVEAGERLDTIKARGFLTCGVGADVPGFSQRIERGAWRGFDVDLCEAMGAAIFGAPGKVAFKPIDTLETFLRDKDIDVVLRGLSWTFGREVAGQLRFGPVVLYDGQAFLVPKKLNLAAADALSGKTICVSTDAEFLTGLRTYFRQRSLILRAVIKDKRAQASDAFFAGQCEAMSADASELAEALIGKAARADDYVILPERISKEPLAPLLRKGDDQFFDIVSWAMFALIDAEELGIEASNVERMRSSDDPDKRAFFASPPVGSNGFSASWTFAIIKSVGNYGEIYQRNLGGPAKLQRGFNRLWTGGGLLYAPPIR